MKNLKKFALCVSLLGLSTFALYSEKSSQPTPTDPSVINSEVHHTVYELESLFVLMQERLSLMHDVAKYKWKTDEQAKILEGELLELNEMGQENDAFVYSFFEAQNEAAHKIIAQDYTRFEQQKLGRFENVKDYQTELLPQLQAIDSQMLTTLNQLLIHTQNESLPMFLKEISFPSFQNEGFDRTIYDVAVDPLFQD